MTEAEALAAVAKAALAWGDLAEPPVLANIRENVVAQVRFGDGRRAALRLHRPGYQTQAAIEGELDWTARLAARGFAVPAPMATRDGGYLGQAAGRLASVVGWLAGHPLGRAGEPLTGSLREQAALFERLGALIARLHIETDALHFDIRPQRPDWDIDGLLGEEPRWGRFWDNPAFEGGERAEVLRARDLARRELAARQAAGADYGLIHADVMRENVLDQGATLALIDFDDSGYGFRAYDLGTAMIQNMNEPALPHLADALLRGYGATRPDRAINLADLGFFTMLRGFASAGWILTRATPDDPRLRHYADRTLRLARAYLEGRSAFGGPSG